MNSNHKTELEKVKGELAEREAELAFIKTMEKALSNRNKRHRECIQSIIPKLLLAWASPQGISVLVQLEGETFSSPNLLKNTRHHYKQAIYTQKIKIGALEVYFDEKAGADSYIPFSDPKKSFIDLVAKRLGDNTEKIWIQDTLVKTESIVKSSNNAILCLDLNGNIIHWNLAAENTYGYSAKLALGQNVDFLLPPDCKNKIKNILQSILQNKTNISHQTVFLTKKGKLRDVTLHLSPINDNKKEIISISIIVRDTTEEKKDRKSIEESELLYRRRFWQEHRLNNVLYNICTLKDKTTIWNNILSFCLELTDSSFGFICIVDKSSGEFQIEAIESTAKNDIADINLPLFSEKNGNRKPSKRKK